MKNILKIDYTKTSLNFLTSDEGQVRIQYKFLVPIYVFPEMKLFGRIGLPILLQPNRRPILEVYKSLTDT
jgi:hypothetical protein